MNRTRFLVKLFAYSLLLLGLPTLASAQWNRDDDYYRNNRRSDNYDTRYVVDAARRVKNNSRSFRRALDRALDHSRYDDSRREDRINDVAKDFANAADRLEDRIGRGRNLNNSSAEARELLQLAAQIDRVMGRNSFDYQAENEWSQMRGDLQTIANAYGYSFNNRNNGGWNNNDRGRRNDRDDDYNRSRNNRDDDNNRRRRNRNGRWGGNWPF